MIVLLCVTYQFLFCNHVDGEKRAGCLALFVFLASHDCYVALPHDANGLSAVCDISEFYSLTIFPGLIHYLSLMKNMFDYP